MANRTTAELIERALQIVDQVGAGQTATAEDTQLALKALTSILDELETREIVLVTIDEDDLSQEDIHGELFNPLADLLAADLQTTFAGGRVADDVREGIINRIRRVTWTGPSYATLETKYY
jgi:hypothetical protein